MNFGISLTNQRFYRFYFSNSVIEKGFFWKEEPFYILLSDLLRCHGINTLEDLTELLT